MSTTTQTYWWSTSYPSRYYLRADTSNTLGTYPMASGVDVAMYSAKPDWLPDASDMIALTEAQWNSRSLVNQIIKDGTAQTYVATTTTTTSTDATTTTTSTAS